MVKFGYTILYVEDVNRSIKFYEKAFGLKRKLLTPDGAYGELDTGGTTLSFASIALAKSNLPDGFVESNPAGQPFGIEIGLTTPDVEKCWKKAVQSGATGVAPPKTKPWGQVVAYVRDPDGFLVEICTPME
jgi:uncharacterized glyoxalase superfamily protein PhnB